ncbi:MAG: phosphohydrolase [Chitinophagaceae bacterium]|nr:phosphohydrolase [Chitinophagaceae bacterium]
MDNQLLQDAQTQVTDLLVNKLNKSISFHTLQHTQEVVAAAEKLSHTQDLSEEDRLALITAAWFHDTGYTTGIAKDHETASIQLAAEFLAAHQVSPEFTAKVIGCINATRMPQHPSSPIEEMICDADLFHLGTPEFREKSKLLRQEIREFGGYDMSKKEWRQNNIAFLESHHYFTPFAQSKLQPVKEKFLQELKEKKEEEMKPEKAEKKKEPKEKKDKGSSADQLAILEAKAKKDKANQTERGISTVFRIMAQNQNNLSQMADSKANILISVNAIILSIVVSSLYTKLRDNPNLLIPLVVLVTVCVAAIVFAILATRPNVVHGKFTEDDIRTKKTNLLFFGNFFRMGLTDYSWAMQEMLADKDYLYSSIVKDNYFLGVVLAKKYSFLRIAYNIFMYGLILAILAFALAFAMPSETY